MGKKGAECGASQKPTRRLFLFLQRTKQTDKLKVGRHVVSRRITKKHRLIYEIIVTVVICVVLLDIMTTSDLSAFVISSVEALHGDKEGRL